MQGKAKINSGTQQAMEKIDADNKINNTKIMHQMYCTGNVKGNQVK